MWIELKSKCSKNPSIQLEHLARQNAKKPATSGQLISKFPYEKSVSTKYQRKYFSPASLLLQGWDKKRVYFLFGRR